MAKREKIRLIGAVLLAVVAAVILACSGGEEQENPVSAQADVSVGLVGDVSIYPAGDVTIYQADPGGEVGPHQDPYENGMIVSPSESGEARPGHVMVLVFRADGPFTLRGDAREKLLGVGLVPGEDALEVLGWIPDLVE